MGKRYHCDYCNKTMVAAPAIVRTHNNGLTHQKLVQEHYRQYKDPETILQEEANKKPCLRFAKGECQFGALCRFSHYSREEMNSLKEYVTSKNSNILNQQQPSFEDLYQKLQYKKAKGHVTTDGHSTIVYDSTGVTYKLPWTCNDVLDSYGDDLPPSIKKIRLEDFRNAEIVEWG